MRHERSIALTPWWLWLHVAIAMTPTLGARAQAPASVGVLRSTGDRVPEPLAKQVDDVLLRELATTAAIANPTISAEGYESVQLAVGCQGETQQCLSSMAETLRADAVIVRRLSIDASGITTLDLYYLDRARSNDVVFAQDTIPFGSTQSIVASVPRLVRKLFGLAGPQAGEPNQPAAAAAGPDEAVAPGSDVAPAAVKAQDEPEPAADRSSSLGTWAWIAVGSGAVVLGTGVVVGMTAMSSFEGLKKADPTTAADVRRIRSDFDSIETRGTIANVLMPIGAAALVAGVVMLVIDGSHGDGSERAASELRLVPTRGGAMLSLTTALEGP